MTIYMLAPLAGMTFASMPSGSVYVADANAIVYITNGSTADQLALQSAGCITLSPVEGGPGTPTIGFATLAALYSADTSTHYGLGTIASVINDTGTPANNGIWSKTGAGNGSGNWTQQIQANWKSGTQAGGSSGTYYNIWYLGGCLGIGGPPNPNPPADAQGVLTTYYTPDNLPGAWCPTGGSNDGSPIHFYVCNGTVASPTYAQAGAGLLAVAGRPFNNVTNAYTGSVFAIEGTLLEDANGVTYPGCNMSFQISMTGSNTRVEQMLLQDGRLGLGTTRNSIAQGTNTLMVIGNASDTVLNVQGSVHGGFLYSGTNAQTWSSGESATASALFVRKDSSTSRSISAAGTINASGADYADYETKRSDCGEIAKGAVCGYDADGFITDKWSLAVAFGVKSTDPSYVGGDSHASEAALKMKKPEPPAEPTIPPKPLGGIDFNTKEEYLALMEKRRTALVAWRAQVQKHRTVDMPAHQAELAKFHAAVAAARGPVDRIAKAGKVPCIVSGPVAAAGYVVAEAGPDGSIVGVCKMRPSDEERARVIGRVRVAGPGRDRIGSLVDLGKVAYDPAWTAIVEVMHG